MYDSYSGGFFTFRPVTIIECSSIHALDLDTEALCGSIDTDGFTKSATSAYHVRSL